MADEKKKPTESTDNKTINEIIYLLAGLFVLALILNQITNYLISLGWGDVSNIWNYFAQSYLLPVWAKWKIISIVISVLIVIWMAYSYYMLRAVEEEEKDVYGSVIEDSFLEEVGAKESKSVERWKKIMGQSDSTNPSDWRMAIIEADIMLEELLREKGFPGDTLGEMLKGAKPGDFISIDAAWEAHKIRNKIAHGGNDFQLTDRETRRAIALFEAVFKEFGAI